VVDLRGEKDIEQLRLVALAQRTQIDLLVRSLREALKDNPVALQQALLELEERARNAPAVKPESDESPSSEPKEKKKRTQFGNTPQPKLPEIEQIFELDAPDKTCPSCGGELAPMKDQFETSEMVDVVEVSYRVVKVKQQKYSCKCGGCVETALGPERAVSGGRYSLDFAIKIAIDKYLDHIPLARQERIMARHGLAITTQTLWDQLNVLGRRLESASAALLARALSQPVVGLDQTSWPCLDGKKDKPWQIWCITAPKIVVHRIRDDKSAITFGSLMKGYKGIAVCDAAQTHGAGLREEDCQEIVLAGCWAHVYRKFEEAMPNHPEAHLALEWIGKLYEIDERAAGDLERVAELRHTESLEILEQLKTWLWVQAPLKSLSIGNAAAYTVANWQRLTRFIDDPRIPLDNNATERAIRGPVVGRRNHFGSKSKRGTEIAATFYTLLETAKLEGIDPATYLREAALANARGEVLLPGDLAR
jgi:transposase